MEQRLLRLGDIVDDYCPRERRITNHAIVAIVEDAIRQTRCTTCDAEHVYKRAKEPLRRRTDAPVPATATAVSAPSPGTDLPFAPASATPAATAVERRVDSSPAPESPATTDVGDGEPAAPNHEDGWLAHRQLIRASLPRIEGEPPAPRPIPEFTMHQRPPSRGGFRFGHGRHGGGDNHGNGPGRGDFGNGRGAPADGRNGNRNGQPGGGRSGRHRGHGKRPR
jgi:hypothetical protein